MLLFIFLLALGLRLVNLDRADMQGDEAMNAYRSIGYNDNLNSERQTTPTQWFENPPWWTKLSFHDQPPLGFLIQHTFFTFFGISTQTARLPMAVFGALSVLALYLLGRSLFKRQAGLLAALVMSVFAYHVWISRTGYFESILIFFCLLSLYYMQKLAADPAVKNYLLLGVFLGLAFLTKYTMFFLLPTVFFYLLWSQKKIFFSKKFLLTVVIFLIIISPVIFYNFKVYQTRGHFDVHFAKLFGQDLGKDWPIIGNDWQIGEDNLKSVRLWSNFKGIIITLRQNFGLLNLIIFVAASLLMFFQWFKKKDKKFLLYFLSLVFLILQFLIISPVQRLLPLFIPWFALAIGYAIYYLSKIMNKKFYYLFQILVVYLILANLLLCLNTAIADNEQKINNKYLRRENYGFEQLHNYLINQEINFKETLFIYENKLDWFCRFWYFYADGEISDRSYASIEYVLKMMKEDGNDYFPQIGFKNFYYIQGLDTLIDNQVQSNYSEYFINQLDKNNIKIKDIIYRDDGRVAFNVYFFH